MKKESQQEEVKKNETANLVEMRNIFQQQKLDIETHTIIEKVLQYFETKKE
jgi:hypothetical protein